MNLVTIARNDTLSDTRNINGVAARQVLNYRDGTRFAQVRMCHIGGACFNGEVFLRDNTTGRNVTINAGEWNFNPVVGEQSAYIAGLWSKHLG